jgi:hypothetical protein
LKTFKGKEMSITKKELRDLCDFHRNTFIYDNSEMEYKINRLWFFIKAGMNHSAMTLFNELFDLYGKEKVEINDQFIFEYVNTGETYCPTLIFSGKYQNLHISSYGDFAENRRECKCLRNEN